MKKVVFSVTRIGRQENFKTTGVGYVTDEDLLIPAISKAGKPYIRVFTGAIKYCHSVLNRQDEFAGSYYEIREIDIETENSGYEKREIEMNYNLWFKYQQFSGLSRNTFRSRCFKALKVSARASIPRKI